MGVVIERMEQRRHPLIFETLHDSDVERREIASRLMYEIVILNGD